MSTSGPHPLPITPLSVSKPCIKPNSPRNFFKLIWTRTVFFRWPYINIQYNKSFISKLTYTEAMTSIKLMNSSEGSNEGLKWGSQRRTWRCAMHHMEQIRYIICLTFLFGGLLITLAWSTDHLTEQSIRVKWPLPAFFWVFTIITGRSEIPPPTSVLGRYLYNSGNMFIMQK